MNLPNKVTIVEVGPRDGLQNEPVPIATETKLAMIAKLVEAGVTHIEATSFVHPQAIPQLADAAEVANQLPQHPNVIYSALVPNERGLDRALECGIKRIALFTAASDSFTKININMTVDESIKVFKPIVKRALSAGVTVRGYVSTCFVCPYEGPINEQRVLEVAKQLLDLGVDEVSISDTIGAAVPTDVTRTVSHLLGSIPLETIALHFHDTYGCGLANVYAGLQLGVTTYDSSAGGLGGCPYAPGASGNLATEDLVYMLDGMGIDTGISLDRIVEAADIIAKVLNKPLHSRQWQRIRSQCQA